MIYIIDAYDLVDDLYIDELSDKQVKELANWHFNDWKEFIKAFNSDGDYAPMPNQHYIVELND